jgi:hypothetical protein
MPLAYPIPWKLAFYFALAIVTRCPRPYRPDALEAVRTLKPPCEVRGQECIPASGPYLLTTNHYYRPGFRAWWITLALSAALPEEIHWITTAAWTFPGR